MKLYRCYCYSLMTLLEPGKFTSLNEVAIVITRVGNINGSKRTGELVFQMVWEYFHNYYFQHHFFVVMLLRAVGGCVRHAVKPRTAQGKELS